MTDAHNQDINFLSFARVAKKLHIIPESQDMNTNDFSTGSKHWQSSECAIKWRHELLQPQINVRPGPFISFVYLEIVLKKKKKKPAAPQKAYEPEAKKKPKHKESEKRDWNKIQNVNKPAEHRFCYISNATNANIFIRRSIFELNSLVLKIVLDHST